MGGVTGGAWEVPGQLATRMVLQGCIHVALQLSKPESDPAGTVILGDKDASVRFASVTTCQVWQCW